MKNLYYLTISSVLLTLKIMFTKTKERIWPVHVAIVIFFSLFLFYLNVYMPPFKQELVTETSESLVV